MLEVKVLATLAQRLADFAGEAGDDAELRKRWIDQGYVIWNAKASDLAERMRREHALWAEVTKGMAFE